MMLQVKSDEGMGVQRNPLKIYRAYPTDTKYLKACNHKYSRKRNNKILPL